MMGYVTKCSRSVFRLEFVFGLMLLGVGFATTAAQAQEEAGPVWQADFSVLYLQERIEGGGENVFWHDTNEDQDLDPGEPLVNTDEVESDWGDPLSENIGFRLEIGHMPVDRWGFSVVYLTRRAEQTESVINTDEDLEPTFGPPGVDPDLADAEEAGMVIFDYETKLDHIELLAHAPVWQPNENLRVRGRVGPVFAQIEDEFEMEIFDDWPIDYIDRYDIDVHTENDMYGLVVGAEAVWQCNPKIALVGDVSVGPYYNKMELSTDFREFDGSDRWSAHDSQSALGIMGDMSVAAQFAVTQNVALRLGYMLMWRSDTARAIKQIGPGEGLAEDASDTAHPEIDIDRTLYHGATAAVVVNW